MSTNTSAIASVFSDVSYEASKNSTVTEKDTTLSQDDFLKLLTAQMEHQDPMSPMSDTEFISQMANFTSLEQTKDISSTLTGMSEAQQTIGLTSYLGKTVTIDDNGTEVTGEVDAITSDSEALYVEVNGKQYSPATIKSVATTSTEGNS